MTEATSYTDFLKQKIRMASFNGFYVPMPSLFALEEADVEMELEA